MDKLLLLSIMIGMMSIPVRTARNASPPRGFVRLVVQMVVFEALYAVALKFFWSPDP